MAGGGMMNGTGTEAGGAACAEAPDQRPAGYAMLPNATSNTNAAVHRPIGVPSMKLSRVPFPLYHRSICRTPRAREGALTVPRSVHTIQAWHSYSHFPAVAAVAPTACTIQRPYSMS